MWAFLKRTIAPRGLGLAFMLALIPLFCRADNAFAWVLEAQGVVLPFAVALCIGILAGAAMIAFINPKSNGHRALWAVLGSVCCFAGVVAAGFAEIVAPFVCALLSGFLVGLGLALSLHQWFIIYAPLRLDTSIVTASIAFLLASALWYVIRHVTTFYVMLFCMSVCIACSGLLCLMFLVVDTQSERLAPEREAELEMGEGGAGAQDPSESFVPISAAGDSTAQFEPRWIGGAAALGLWFNFFTLGLTFFPEAAGVASQAITIKPLPYLIVLVVLAVATFFVSRRENGYATFLIIMLAIAAAIVLASPFLEEAVDPGSHLMDFAYAGIALFNVLGFALPLQRMKETDREFALGSAVLVAGSALCMAAGMIVFQLIGQSGQLVSLCLMTAYLVMLVALSVRSGIKAAKEPAEEAGAQSAAPAGPTAPAGPAAPTEPEASAEPEKPAEPEEPATQNAPAEAAAAASNPAELPDRRKLACERLAQEYQLSPRESEVLWLLARGYGTRYIADKLCISADTVRTHCKRIYEKAGVHTKEELIELVESFERQS